MLLLATSALLASALAAPQQWGSWGGQSSNPWTGQGKGQQNPWAGQGGQGGKGGFGGAKGGKDWSGIDTSAGMGALLGGVPGLTGAFCAAPKTPYYPVGPIQRFGRTQYPCTILPYDARPDYHLECVYGDSRNVDLNRVVQEIKMEDNQDSWCQGKATVNFECVRRVGNDVWMGYNLGGKYCYITEGNVLGEEQNTCIQQIPPCDQYQYSRPAPVNPRLGSNNDDDFRLR